MTVHEDLMKESVVPNLFEHFGETSTVQYKAAGGVGVALTAIIGTRKFHNNYETGKQTGGVKRVAIRSITITDAPAGLFGGADVKPNATLEIAGVDWAIVSTTLIDGGMWTIEAHLEESGQQTRPGYYERG